MNLIPIPNDFYKKMNRGILLSIQNQAVWATRKNISEELYSNRQVNSVWENGLLISEEINCSYVGK